MRPLMLCALGLGTLTAATVLSIPGVKADSVRKSPYAGQEHRAIKSLSGADVKTLKSGGGWGFAKAAELNGWPGPLHVLELADALKLSTRQRQDVKSLFEKMRAAAIPLGHRLVNLERRLDQMFATRKVTPENLAALTRQISEVRAKLRAVHLSAHLTTPKILTAAQIGHYNRLRGYGTGPKAHGHGHQHKHKHD